MVFNSLEFAAFFCAVFCAYWCLPRRAQNRFLLVASYVFYGAWDWRFLGLIVLSTGVDFLIGRALGTAPDAGRRRLLVTTSLVVNLGILGVFKYADWFSASFAALAGRFGWQVDSFTLGVVLPVGISFYTFQTLSYTIDIYRGELEPSRDLLDFALFVAFFPQLVAGPIERASRLLPQIHGARRFDLESLETGGWLVLWGLVKKVVIADNLSLLVDAVYAQGAEPTATQIALATYAFAIQIYCDFSGYSNIARGVAHMLGFRLMVNFDLPYFARGPSDFWRRWHISLSTWLRDYLYIPLGGNRGGRIATYRNLLLTMLLGGIWHGAAWAFVAWGLLHGAWLAIDRALRATPRAPLPLTRLSTWARMAVTFHLVCLGWVFFRAGGFLHGAGLLAGLFTPWSLADVGPWLPSFFHLILPLALFELVQEATGDHFVVFRLPFVLRVVVYTGLCAAVVLLGQDFGQPFIYFQF
ncbi:MAG: MBOAT family protein [Acidobacteriota bacterium]